MKAIDAVMTDPHTCPRCNIEKTNAEFFAYDPKPTDKRRTVCRDCKNEHSKQQKREKRARLRAQKGMNETVAFVKDAKANVAKANDGIKVVQSEPSSPEALVNTSPETAGEAWLKRFGEITSEVEDEMGRADEPAMSQVRIKEVARDFENYRISVA